MNTETFHHTFTHLTNQKTSVAWIRSLDYTHQLYLSPQFETTFNAPLNTLYDTPSAWIDFVCKEDSDHMRNMLSNRENHLKKHSWDNIEESTHFRIRTPNGNIRYMKDWVILLRNQCGEIAAIAGITQQISSAAWQQTTNEQTPAEPAIVLPNGRAASEVLLEEKKLTISETKQQAPPRALNINGRYVTLTKCQIKCLEKLCQGYSAKQTAGLLHLSPRTIENHLAAIKIKTQCRSNIQLISQALPQLLNTWSD